MASLQGRLYALTGASSGIGRATALLLAARGASLSLADVAAEPLRALAAQLCEQHSEQVFSTHPLDVADGAAVRAWLHEATPAAHPGQPLAGAANLAGVLGASAYTAQGTFAGLPETEARRVVDVSLWGTFNCLRAELDYAAGGTAAVRRGAEGRGGGSIVNMASIAGVQGVAGHPAYVAAKHAVVGLTRAASKEAGGTNGSIRVNAVAPGVIDTPMIQAAEKIVGVSPANPSALGRKGAPEEVAELIAFLLGDESSYINGQIISVDGGWHG